MSYREIGETLRHALHDAEKNLKNAPVGSAEALRWAREVLRIQKDFEELRRLERAP